MPRPNITPGFRILTNVSAQGVITGFYGIKLGQMVWWYLSRSVTSPPCTFSFCLPSSLMNVLITMSVQYCICTSVLKSSRWQYTLVYYLQWSCFLLVDWNSTEAAPNAHMLCYAIPSIQSRWNPCAQTWTHVATAAGYWRFCGCWSVTGPRWK